MYYEPAAHQFSVWVRQLTDMDLYTSIEPISYGIEQKLRLLLKECALVATVMSDDGRLTEEVIAIALALMNNSEKLVPRRLPHPPSLRIDDIVCRNPLSTVSYPICTPRWMMINGDIPTCAPVSAKSYQWKKGWAFAREYQRDGFTLSVQLNQMSRDMDYDTHDPERSLIGVTQILSIPTENLSPEHRMYLERVLYATDKCDSLTNPLFGKVLTTLSQSTIPPIVVPYIITLLGYRIAQFITHRPESIRLSLLMHALLATTSNPTSAETIAVSVAHVCQSFLIVLLSASTMISMADRIFAANALAITASRYQAIAPSILGAYQRIVTSPQLPLTTITGAILGIKSMGQGPLSTILIPVAVPLYTAITSEEVSDDRAKETMKAYILNVLAEVVMG